MANFGWVSISSQPIFSKVAFHLSSSYVLFFFLVWAQHSVNTCLVNWIHCLHRQSSEPNPGTFLKYRNFLRPIFSILISIIRVLTALQKCLYNPSIFFIGFEQIACSFLPIFLLDHASSHSPNVFCFNASLIMILALPSTCLSTVYLKSHSLQFPFLLFTFLYSITSLASTSVSSFPFIYIWRSI